jgi:DNA-binding CsgD family transcriptional regulator
VKTHLKAIYEKLGVDRQSALVRRIATMLAAMGH